MRHGGVSSCIRTARRHEERKTADARIAVELPLPLTIVQPVPEPAEPVSTPQEPLDRELAAMGAILTALEGLTSSQVRRTLAYIADRTGAEDR